ncbi:MAG: hybrid sensor histidine kinase/response regulator [Gammaproteobacteria bacterium]|nr:hybrid sensor histidine kinase/response regulator [Gammaproteobacteria bacterium]
MTATETERSEGMAPPKWRPGVRARLLLAFFGIAAFAVLAAAAGIYAFREVGSRLEVIDARVPPSVSALELSRSAERIIAAAPALLAAVDRTRRDAVNAELAGEVARLNRSLNELNTGATQALPLENIEPVVSRLTASLDSLEDVVARRLETSERIRALRRDVFQTSIEVQRLLAPWLKVMDHEIAARAGPGERSSNGSHLESLIQTQKAVHTAQQQVSAAVDMLTEASTIEQAERLPVLDFQLGLAMQDIVATSRDLDPRLRRLFLEQVARLREFVDGPDAIVDARRRELMLNEQGERILAETSGLSARLTTAVDRLGHAAKQDIGDAIRDALRVQRLSGRVLIVLVALSLVTSVLIVWFYVGGNIVRRLTSLSDSMLAIAGGRLGTPVAVHGSDEIAAMGRVVEIFRRNAIELEQLLEERRQTATRLEHLVDERTRDLRDKSQQLEVANKYKSHFLASASHDLRQPLHALNLFVAQLQTESDAAERVRLVDRIDATVSAMNELFELLLDMSKLEAGILEPHYSEFPIARVFDRIETTFSNAATQKELRLSVVPSAAWVRSDLVLLERILMNLVSNAVRHTVRGGVVVGCRRRGGRLRIDVCDSGPGIPREEQRNIFGEYYRLAGAGSERGGGFGLGLAIVDRLGRLLDHGIELDSRPGRGSRFSVSLPRVAEKGGAAEASMPATSVDPARGKLVVVIDDDPLVLEGMGGILRGWGCELVTAESGDAALARLATRQRAPNLVVADYRLAGGTTGIQAIQRLRAEYGAGLPAFLISGDTAPEPLLDAREHGIHLLHKPVAPMRLRAMVHHLLNPQHAAGDLPPAATRY